MPWSTRGYVRVREQLWETPPVVRAGVCAVPRLVSEADWELNPSFPQKRWPCCLPPGPRCSPSRVCRVRVAELLLLHCYSLENVSPLFPANRRVAGRQPD